MPFIMHTPSVNRDDEDYVPRSAGDLRETINFRVIEVLIAPPCINIKGALGVTVI